MPKRKKIPSYVPMNVGARITFVPANRHALRKDYKQCSTRAERKDLKKRMREYWANKGCIAWGFVRGVE